MAQRDAKKFADLPFKFVQRKFGKQTILSSWLAPISEFSRKQAEGVSLPCFTSEMIERNEVDETMLKWISATLYAGAADTVSPTPTNMRIFPINLLSI